jgi:hypothetical protein
VGKCVQGWCNGVAKKEEIRRCEFDGPRCHTCEVDLFGGPFWDGWNHTFLPGRYQEEEFRKANIKCMDVSSMIVKGFCCAARLYQYGDRNRREGTQSSWKVLYPEGNYNKEDLEEKGGLDDQASAMEVFVDPQCVEHSKMVSMREHPDNVELHKKKSGAPTLLAVLSVAIAVVMS